MVLESTTSIDSIKHKFNLIKNYLGIRVPGLLDILNTYFIYAYGKDVFTLLLESPCTVYNAINSISKDETTTRCILVYVLLRPIVGVLDQKTWQKLFNDIAKCTDIDLGKIIR